MFLQLKVAHLRRYGLTLLCQLCERPRINIAGEKAKHDNYPSYETHE